MPKPGDGHRPPDRREFAELPNEFAELRLRVTESSGPLTIHSITLSTG